MVPILNHSWFIKLIIKIVIARGLYIIIYFLLNLIDSIEAKKIFFGLIRYVLAVNVPAAAPLMKLSDMLGRMNSLPNITTVHSIK